MIPIGLGNQEASLNAGQNYSISIQNPYEEDLLVHGLTIYYSATTGAERSRVNLIYANQSLIPEGTLALHVGFNPALQRPGLIGFTFAEGERPVWNSKLPMVLKYSPPVPIVGQEQFSIVLFARKIVRRQRPIPQPA